MLIGALLTIAIQTQAAYAAPTQLFSFGPDGTEASDFERLGSLAVDQSGGSVYALDSTGGALYKFGPAGDPLNFGGTSSYIEGNRISGLEIFDVPHGGRAASQVAVNSSADLFFVTEEQSLRAFQADGEPFVFSAGPGEGTSEIPGFAELYGVAVDSEGNIYASDHSGTVSVFAPSGALLTTFSATSPFNLAVDSNGAVLVMTDQTSVKKFTPSALPVSGTTTYAETTFAERPGVISFLTTVAVDPVTDDVFIMETNFTDSWIRRYDKSGTLVETIGEPGTASQDEAVGLASEGLAILGVANEIQPKKTVALYAANTEGEDDSQVTAFGTEEIIAAPVVSNLRVTNLTADSVLFRAAVDPNLKPTTYRFEYGLGDCATSACTSVPLDGAAIGDGSEPVDVSQLVTGLTPATTYHYRIVAENELGGDDEAGILTTQPLGTGFELADGRVWEMVSPPNKRAATLTGSTVGLIQAAASGNGITYLSNGSIEEAPQGNRSLEVSSILSSRGATGWTSKDITPPNERVVPLSVGTQSEYKIFDSELTKSFVEPHSGTPLSPQASERTPYLRVGGNPPVFTPLVTAKEGFANVPAGTEFGGSLLEPNGKVVFAGTNENMTDAVVMSGVPLAPTAPAAPLPALYHWRAGQLLQPLSVLPAIDGGGIVSASLLGSGLGSVQHAISEAGDRIFWSTGGYGVGGNAISGLYVRDTEADETVRLDAKKGGSGLGEPHPVFQGANPDGTVVIFKDSQQLTEGASVVGSDLYRCEIPAGDISAGCATLTNLTSPVGGSGENAEVLGLTSGMSEDATSLYFVAKGVLDSDPNGEGGSAEPGQPNLYRWQEDGGVRFVATLSKEDDPDWGGPAGVSLELSPTASPSGDFFAFMSAKSLTGQPNRDAGTGNPVEEAFLYDAEADELSCVSCNPLGAAPKGEISAGFHQLVDPNRQWVNKWVTAILPQPTYIGNGNSLYQPRAVLENGRVFVNSLDALVPGDSNGQWDVYQFEPLGLGNCNSSSGGSATVRSDNGCISLVSSGTGEGEAVFLDASATGGDVFFYTPARLSVLDQDAELDAYDARVNGRLEQLPLSSECSGQGCQPTSAPPGEGGTSSATFAGSGNVKAVKKCPKGKKKVRRGGKAKCVSKKQKGHQKGKKQSNQKGQGK